MSVWLFAGRILVLSPVTLRMVQVRDVSLIHHCVSLRISCTLRAMASVSSVKLSGKVIFSVFKGDGVYVFIFCYLKCGSKKFIGSNIRHFGRQKQKKGKLFPKNMQITMEKTLQPAYKSGEAGIIS